MKGDFNGSPRSLGSQGTSSESSCAKCTSEDQNTLDVKTSLTLQVVESWETEDAESLPEMI